MKKILPALILLSLTACSKKGSDPEPVQLTTTWTFQSETRTIIPKSGAPAGADLQPIPAGSYTITFNKDGSFRTAATNGDTIASGNYSYVNVTLTSTYLSGSNIIKNQSLAVIELTATRLMTMETSEDTSNRYVTIDTFTR
jgi:hypothetical protein